MVNCINPSYAVMRFVLNIANSCREYVSLKESRELAVQFVLLLMMFSSVHGISNYKIGDVIRSKGNIV